MNIVTIYADNDDAENLAVILLRAEVRYSVERYDDDTDHGFLFTVYEEDKDEEIEG